MMNALVLLGAALAMVGVVGYLATGRKSLTALIPLAFGGVFAALGVWGEDGGTTTTVAIGLAVLGAGATAGGLSKTLRGPRGPAALSKAAMATLCVAFLVHELL